MVIAQDHPDDIYWDRGFGRQSGTSASEIVYDMIIYKNQPISCGRLSMHRGDLEIFNILAWDGLEYIPLDTGVSFYGKSMVEYKNNLIVGGFGYNGISIAEWNGFSWTTLDTGLIGNVEAMTVMNDSVFVGGWFQQDSNSYAWSIAVWDGSTWGKLDGTFNGTINSLTEYNGQLIVGGDFTHINLQNTNSLARRNSSGWERIYYNIGTSVTDIIVWDTMLVIAGDLKDNNKVGLINSLDSLTFLPLSDSLNEINDLIIFNNQITVSTSYTDTLLFGAPILTWDGVGWTSFGNALYGHELSMANWGDSLFVFGNIKLKGQLYDCRSEMWNGIEWVINTDDGILDMTYESELFQNQIVVSGNFDNVGNETSNRFAFYDGDHWSTQGYSDAISVSGLYNNNDTLYVGGYFSEIGGISANSAAMYDGATWTDIGFATKGYIGDFIHYNNKLIVGGDYIQIDSLADRIRLAYRENNSWVPFDEQPNNDVNHFAIYKNNLVVAGKFDSIGTMPAKHIAMWDGTNWTALATSTDHPYTYMGYMLVKNDTLIVTGYFNEINGVKAETIAIWNGNNWSSFGIGDLFPPMSSNSIIAVAEYNNQIVLGGQFDSIAGITAKNIAIWNGTTFSPLGSGISSYPGWDSFSPYVSKLQVFQDELYVFGEFFMAGGIESNNIARWTKNSMPLDIADDEIKFLLPNEYVLEQNYPNPFNPTTEISFTIPKNSIVTLEIFNILGQKVSTLVDGYKSVGEHKITWDASDFASGIYLYRLKADEFISEKKMVLVK